MNTPDSQKAIARQKRIISEVAGEIHDIVEDTLWTHYHQLPSLSARIQELMAELDAIKRGAE